MAGERFVGWSGSFPRSVTEIAGTPMSAEITTFIGRGPGTPDTACPITELGTGPVTVRSQA